MHRPLHCPLSHLDRRHLALWLALGHLAEVIFAGGVHTAGHAIGVRCMQLKHDGHTAGVHQRVLVGCVHTALGEVLQVRRRLGWPHTPGCSIHARPQQGQQVEDTPPPVLICAACTQQAAGPAFQRAAPSPTNMHHSQENRARHRHHAVQHICKLGAAACCLAACGLAASRHAACTLAGRAASRLLPLGWRGGGSISSGRQPAAAAPPAARRSVACGVASCATRRGSSLR